MNKPIEFWRGQGGADYTARNRVDWRARTPFWRSVLAIARPDTVLEFGCNAGWNLRSIREVSPGVGVHGVEINRGAVLEAQKAAGLDVTCIPIQDAVYGTVRADFVFTAGVLIHISPGELQATMQAIVDASTRYVLAIEYAADQEQEIEYRGERGLLWKRDYCALYEALGLKLSASWPPDHVVGFDHCHAWLMEKP